MKEYESFVRVVSSSVISDLGVNSW